MHKYAVGLDSGRRLIGYCQRAVYIIQRIYFLIFRKCFAPLLAGLQTGASSVNIRAEFKLFEVCQRPTLPGAKNHEKIDLLRFSI